MFLRVLETGEFMRLGGTKTLRTDGRVIAATNSDLREAMQTQRFRADLFYRLNAFHIHIPPLCERREDISPLIDAFISELSTEHGKQVTGITQEARRYLKGAVWPGNIRELKNAINKAVITAQTAVLDSGDLPADIAFASQLEDSEDGKRETTRELPPEVSEILARLSVIEFISIFGGIPIPVWRLLPKPTQQKVIREASFHLSQLLGRDRNAISTSGLDRDQILRTVARQRVAEYGSLTQAAKSLGIDRRTLKTYAEQGDGG